MNNNDSPNAAAADESSLAKGSNGRRPRLRYLVLAVAMLAGLLQLFVYTSAHGNAVLDQQARIMGRVLTNQAALAASRVLESRDKSSGEALVNNLASVPFIIDATLYNSEGEAVAQSKDAIKLPELLGFGGNEPVLGERRVAPYLGNIRADGDGELLGYMRITLNHDALRDTMAEPRANTFDIARILLLMAGAMGFFLALAIVRR
ncbi:MAG: hypothetical protein II007_07235 [Gammaproteobacteria bacterium]|nr:hypothetical protein [Gammaproteobacteria bacterium]